MTSLPEISLPALSQPNRWSLIDTSHGFSGAGVSSRSLNSPSDSEGSELQFSMDSLLESGTESERWVRGHGKAPSFPALFPVLLLDEGRRSGDEVASLSHTTFKTVVDKAAIE